MRAVKCQGRYSLVARFGFAAMALGAVSGIEGCSEPTSVAALVVHGVSANTDSAFVGTPGRRLPQQILAQVTGQGGQPVSGALVTWSVAGAGGWVDSATASTGTDGEFGAIWHMGTNAAEPQVLEAEVRKGGESATITFSARLVASEVKSIVVTPDTTTVKLRVATTLGVRATDPYGNLVTTKGAVDFTSLDSAVAAVDSLGTVRSFARGWARVVLSAPGVCDTARVHVIQVVAAIQVTPDTVRFTSLAQRRNVFAYLVDDQGYDVADSLPIASVADTTIVARAGTPLVFQSRANGRTTLSLAVGTLQKAVPMVVAQVPESTAASVVSSAPILLLPVGAKVPVVCQAWDSNGAAITTPPVVTTSATGAVAGTTCASLTVARSGVDTLHVSFGGAPVLVPVAVAAPPVLTPPLAQALPVDSYPSFYLAPYTYAGSYQHPGVPSLRRNSQGQLELYVSLLVEINQTPWENLYRYVSNDGVHFQYDGLVLQHDTSSECALLGFGIENVAVVPRADAAGWRMYFSGGSFKCYGWQVFSATSSDEKNWTIESGVRVSNGGALQPDSTAPAPWPVGEGMVVDRLSSGGWRMLVGGYDHSVTENKFQLVEWDSPDQLNWTYVGAVLRTDSMPIEADASIFSPTVRKFAPGLWRMVFSGDNRDQLGGRYTLWSAVSTDDEHWQVEGQLMGQTTGNFYYAAVVDSTLITMRDSSDVVPTGSGLGRYLAVSKIVMP